MKKLLSFLAMAGLACSALTGCVEDNSTVVAKGVTGGSSCSASSEDQAYYHALTCDPSAPMKSGAKAQLALALHIMNYMTGNSVWSSSSSGSGTTLNATQPNAGSIFIDKIRIACDRINGDTSACNSREDKIINVNYNVPASGGACIGFFVEAEEFNWGDEVTLDITAEYHDSSLIKGKTSHAKFSFHFIDSQQPDKFKFLDACTLERDEISDSDNDEGKGEPEEDPESEKK